MKRITTQASTELLQLIKKLKNESKFLNNQEFISVMNATQSICEDKHSIEYLINCLNLSKDYAIAYDENLTKREMQVFIHISQGDKNKQIAKKLNLSIFTVETHRKNIRKKLKLNKNESLYAVALMYAIQKTKM